MKATIVATILAASSLVAAAPSYGTHELKHEEDDSWKSFSPINFTSVYSVKAEGDQVINTTQIPAPGQPGATGLFNYGIIGFLDIICYDIQLFHVTGPYQSPARTATHIHQAPKGRSGPPRIAFPNPVGDDNYRRSVGCLSGPFTTGVLANGVDTGVGFKVQQIEDDPEAFFTDTHTALFVPGVVRGQLYKLEH